MKHFSFYPWLAGLLCTLALPTWAAFIDNGDGTITDATTGLVWDKCSIGQTWDNATPPGTCTGATTLFNWAGAMSEAIVANGAGHRGRADWRLPNVTELESLIKLDVASGTMINDAVFPATLGSSFWTSTTAALNTGAGWVVYFSNGLPLPIGKTSLGPVRLVRSGQWSADYDVLLDVTPPALSALGVTGTTTTATTLQATSNCLWT